MQNGLVQKVFVGTAKTVCLKDGRQKMIDRKQERTKKFNRKKKHKTRQDTTPKRRRFKEK
jgi:hypothetical protein